MISGLVVFLVSLIIIILGLILYFYNSVSNEIVIVILIIGLAVMLLGFGLTVYYRDRSEEEKLN